MPVEKAIKISEIDKDINIAIGNRQGIGYRNFSGAIWYLRKAVSSGEECTIEFSRSVDSSTREKLVRGFSAIRRLDTPI